MNIAEFEQKLSKRGLNHENLTPLNSGYVHFRFTGPFDDELTIWDAHLYSLAYYIKEIQNTGQKSARQFIIVGDENGEGRELRIGLNVPIINAPTLEKTIIMIRQYKNLKLGRHEYGESIDF